MSDYKYQRIITKEGEPTIVKEVYVPDEVVKQIRADAINDYYNELNEKINTDTRLKDTIKDIHDNVSQEMYCKGIDDFMKALITMYERYDIDAVLESSDTYSYTNACCIFEDYIKEIAEELKEQK